MFPSRPARAPPVVTGALWTTWIAVSCYITAFAAAFLMPLKARANSAH